MRCLCGKYLPMPERHDILECAACGRRYNEEDDLGWWQYSIEIYTPVEFVERLMDDSIKQLILDGDKRLAGDSDADHEDNH